MNGHLDRSQLTKGSFKLQGKALRLFLAVAFIICGIEATALADRVRTLDGSIEGKIVNASRKVINLETEDGTQAIEVNEVIGVLFEEEPSGLSQARINLANGGYKTVLERIEGTQLPRPVNPILEDDFAFIQAEATARLAINKQADPREAGRLIVSHQKKYPLSFHYYETVETLGDLLRSMGRFDRAIKQYELLSKAPWPSYQSRAALLSGLVRQEQGNHAAAIALFDKAITSTGNTSAGSGEVARRQGIEAKLAKTQSMAQNDQKDEALEQIRAIILSANAKDELGQYALAAGYNALGNYYLAEGDTTEALLAFLRVDYLYEQTKKVHAESLFHLVLLWNRYGEPEPAKLARGKLRRLYPETVWASRIK